MFDFTETIHKEKFSCRIHFFSLPISHTHTQHSHFIKQLSVHDRAETRVDSINWERSDSGDHWSQSE